jgi:hypothetical protein
MLTSYWVRCPHGACHWSGSLLPQKTDTWHGAQAVVEVVVFQCPHCQAEWRARVVGDDVVPLAEERTSAR